jgi:hypothetical protein
MFVREVRHILKKKNTPHVFTLNQQNTFQREKGEVDFDLQHGEIWSLMVRNLRSMWLTWKLKIKLWSCFEGHIDAVLSSTVPLFSNQRETRFCEDSYTLKKSLSKD